IWGPAPARNRVTSALERGLLRRTARSRTAGVDEYPPGGRSRSLAALPQCPLDATRAVDRAPRARRHLAARGRAGLRSSGRARGGVRPAGGRGGRRARPRGPRRRPGVGAGGPARARFVSYPEHLRAEVEAYLAGLRF